MTTKQEILQIINNLPNDKLAEVLQYLRTIEKISQDNFQNSENLQRIVKEDNELLKKLAK